MLKKLLPLTVALVNVIVVYNQDKYCGTNFKEDTSLARFRLSNAQRPSTGSMYSWANPLQPCKKATLRVFIHNITNNDGTLGNLSPINTISSTIMAELNSRFNPLNIYFEKKGDEQISSTAIYNNFTFIESLGGDFNADGKFDYFNLNAQDDAIDIYILQNTPTVPVIGQTTVDGIAAEIGSTSLVVFGQTNTPLNLKTLVHEMGHCLGLYHTFHGACGTGEPGNDEDEKNPFFTGDYVDDTPPDPTHDFNQVDANCNNVSANIRNLCTNATSSLSGAGFNPLPNNFMDYISDACRTGLTNGQGLRMRTAIAYNSSIQKTVVKTTGTLSINVATTSICKGTTVNLQAVASSNNYYFDWQGLSTASTLSIAPTSTTTYQLRAWSYCEETLNAQVTITVDDNAAPIINGVSSICYNNTNTTYNILNTSNVSTIGSWSTSNNIIATVNSSGIVAPVTNSNQTFTLNYSTTSTPTNCNITASKVIAIIPANSIVNIDANTTNVCKGDYVTLNAIGTIGLNYSWTNVSNTSVVLNNTNVYEFIPTSTATYNLNAVSACGETINRTITINSIDLPKVVITPIIQPLCSNGNIASLLYNYNYPASEINATWEVVNTKTNIVVSGMLDDIATPTQITTNLPGSYKLRVQLSHTSYSCVATIESETFFVTATNPQIFGNTVVCTNKTYNFTSDALNGTWELSNSAVASINPVTGQLNAIAQGSTAITYKVDVCGVIKTVTKVIIIQETPSLIGNQILSLCNPSYNFIATPAGGTWSSDNITIATVDNFGLVIPKNAGSTRITYDPIPNTCVTDRLLLEITVIPCSTTPCTNVKTIPLIGNGASNTITGGLFNNGVFEIKNDITINGTVNFYQSQVLVAQNVKITVVDGGFLNIENSHFYSCNGMWQGIKVLGDNAKISIQSNSLIEDAINAVYYKPTTKTPNYGTGKILSIKNTIFNRNENSIVIEDIEDDYLGGNLPLEIGNCVFTSRNIIFDPNTIAWENIEAIKATTLTINTPYLQTPLSYNAPYIDNTKFADNVPAAFLKVGTNKKPNAAISLINVGKLVNGVHKNITIGSSPSTNTLNFVPTNTTVFDNHNYGINAFNSNFNVQNCSFQNPKVPTGLPAWQTNNGYGIFAESENEKYNSINITTPSGNPNNSFFGLKNAITVLGAYKLNIRNTDLRGNLGFASKTNKGITASGHFYTDIQIKNNAIHNVATGIWFMAGADRTATNYGLLNISNNTIEAELATLPISNGYLRHAIQVEATIYGDGNLQPMVCSNNKISDAVNGIKLSGWRAAHTQHNTITLKQDAATSPINNQFGICLEAGYGSLNAQEDNKIEENTITGYNLNNNTTGILLNQQTGTFIGCNTVGNLRHGFRFFGFNPLTKFSNNTMLTTNKYGFTLDNGGIIEKQGNENLANGMVCTSDNNWEQPSSYWQTLTGQYMTNCINSDATQSPLVVNPNTPFLNPDGSGLLTSSGIFYQSNSNPLLNSIQFAISNPLCIRCGGQGNYAREEGNTILEDIANGYVNIPNDEPTERLQVMQQQLYEMLQNNPELQNMSEDLEKFVHENAWTGLDYIHFTGYYFAQKNMPMVTQLLNLWPTTTNTIENNYKLYFSWMLQMYNSPTWVPNMQTALAMGNKCPIKQGNIIYAFRNLYNQFNGEIYEFDDNCDAASRGTNVGFIRLKQPPKKNVIVKDNLNVYPNPTVQSITLVGSLIKLVEVYDLAGKRVLVKHTLPTNNVALDLGKLQKGIYLLHVFDGNKKLQVRKIVKQ